MIQITPAQKWRVPIAPDGVDISPYQVLADRDQYLYNAINRNAILLEMLSARIQQLTIVTAAMELKLSKLASLFDFVMTLPSVVSSDDVDFKAIYMSALEKINEP